MQVQAADSRSSPTWRRTGTRSGARGWALSGDRPALIAFITYLAFGAGFIMLRPADVVGWFRGDDWNFLTTEAGPGSLLHEHFGHWVGIPFLLYRALFSLVGVNSYLPYLFMAVIAHLAVVSLLRVVMRRAGAGPWVSTITAASLLLFAAGANNFLSAFQVTLVGSMALGLGQLLLADHDGPLRGRDLGALLLGLGSLMFSGVGLMMLAVVTAAVLLRRGPRIAAFHALPLLTAYLAWRAAFITGGEDAFGPSLLDAPAWLRDQLGAVAIGLFGPPLVAVVMTAAVTVGLWLAWRPLGPDLIRTAAAPASLAAGAVILSALTWWTRGFFTELSMQEKYTYLQAAAVLPVIAVGLDALVRRHRAGWLLLVPLVVTSALGAPRLMEEPLGVIKSVQLRESLPAIAASPLARQVPPDTPADPTGFFLENPVTVGWLLEAAAAGRVPDPVPGAFTDAEIRLAIGISTRTDGAPPATGRCTPISADAPAVITPEPGDQLLLRAPQSPSLVSVVVVMQLMGDSDEGLPQRRQKVRQELPLLVTLPGLRLRLSPDPDQDPPPPLELCS